jgi:hypothetical protein
MSRFLFSYSNNQFLSFYVLQVTNENREEFIVLCAQHRMLGSGTEGYLAGLLGGFNSIIPASMLENFTPEEVELIVCGQPVVDLADWKANTMYTGGYTEKSDVVVWFWEIIDEMLEVCVIVFFFVGEAEDDTNGCVFYFSFNDIDEHIFSFCEVGRQLVLYFVTHSRTPSCLGFAHLAGPNNGETKRFEIRRIDLHDGKNAGFFFFCVCIYYKCV